MPLHSRASVFKATAVQRRPFPEKAPQWIAADCEAKSIFRYVLRLRLLALHLQLRAAINRMHVPIFSKSYAEQDQRAEWSESECCQQKIGQENEYRHFTTVQLRGLAPKHDANLSDKHPGT